MWIGMQDQSQQPKMEYLGWQYMASTDREVVGLLALHKLKIRDLQGGFD